MQKKTLTQLAILLVLAAVYVIFFSGWFRSQPLVIHSYARVSSYAMRSRRPAPPQLIFGFEDKMRLTEVKAVSLADLATNANPPPVWHLISDSNSLPVDSFRYGQTLRGMRPAVTGARAMMLESNQVYRLFVRAGKLRGQHDFTLAGPAPVPVPAKP